MPLNFGRYLDRLGLKIREQPILLGTVQPVALVADLQSLVSQPLIGSYTVGGQSTAVTAGQVPAVMVMTPRALRIRAALFTSTATAQIIHSQGQSSPPTLLPTVTTLVPVRFEPTIAPEAVWTSGELAPPGVSDAFRPQVRVANGALYPAWLDLRVPAGSWALFHWSGVLGTFYWAFVVDELPNDIAP